MTTQHQLARMQALVDQALAEAARRAAMAGRTDAPVREVHLDLYSGMADEDARALFEAAAQGTVIAQAALVLKDCGSRFICWNCCGLRFDGVDGICPNCDEQALEVPEEIAFALRRVVIDGT